MYYIDVMSETKTNPNQLEDAMNDATLNAFRNIHSAMQTEPTDWEWVGEHMSQRMFGITRTRAEHYAKTYGGRARKMDE